MEINSEVFLFWKKGGWTLGVAGIVLLASLLVSSVVLASTLSTYSITWSTVDGGGATIQTGGAYSLGSTIGQMDANKMSGGSYSMSGGFWGGVDPSFTINLPLISR